MATTSAPNQVIELVERFARNRDSYLADGINEAQLRQEFVNPFFSCLGWDIENRQGYAPAYREVIFEDSLRVGAETKAPDYCFRIGGMRKFFVEAKKPAVNIATDTAPAFQLRRYAWTAKLPLSILTDFEEFAVYDCRVRPVKTDKPSIGRIKFLEFKDYPARWPELHDTFSRDAVVKGSFDKFVEENRARKGTTEVDDAFLEEIERWRDLLARNIALRNPRLTTRELNFAVQRTIDRIIFLRICEDRLIEPYGQLQALLNGERVYPRLKEIYNHADDKYNSGLFHFRPEKNRPEGPDELSLKLNLDDKALKDIIANLYYPDSPYEFSVLPADILGQVYEQFLGKVIRLTAGHQAKVEEKPEVRKAGGVYYTPTYIVDYIVENTVGKLVEDRAPSFMVNLRVLDPACGSGSFLLGAFQYLLSWHRDWYVKDGPEKHTKELFPAQGGDWRLTTAKKKEILLNNIYGVDIDQQAVEVTKLSLLLKVLEGENEQTIQSQLKLWHDRALPDLGSNIKCGNSLIGSDFYQGQQASLFDDEEQRYKVNAFDWQEGFSDIMKRGGFDAVIGNPPYGVPLSAEETQYLVGKFRVSRGVKDVYAFFMEQALSVASGNGRVSFIVPSAWLGGPDYVSLRELLLKHAVERVVLLPFDVFPDAYVDTAIFVAANGKPSADHRVMTYAYGKRDRVRTIDLRATAYDLVKQDEWRKTSDKKFVLDSGTVGLLRTIRRKTALTFNDVISMKRGVLFNRDLLMKRRTSQASFRYFEGDVYRYDINMVLPSWVDFDDRMWERPKEATWFEGTRILLRRLVNRQQRLMASLASTTFITNKNLYSVLPKGSGLDIRAILAVLNSGLVSHLYINQVTQAAKDDFPQVTIKDVLSLPFPDLAANRAGHAKMVSLVERMLKLHKDLPKAHTAPDKTAIERQIAATDKQIDALVYELYGLTEDEIKIVEGRER